MHAAAGIHPLAGFRRGVAGALFALAVAGCASSEGRSGDPSGAGAGGSVLHVTNRNWLDVRVYAIRRAERISLMSITSMRTDSVALPATLLQGGGFRLQADPVGAEPYRSDMLYLRAGQTVWWRLENKLDQSSLWVH